MKNGRSKRRLLLTVVLAIVIVLTAAFCREYALKQAQQDFSALLQSNAGKYNEDVIVLSGTSHSEAKRLADVFGGTLRITENGRFATITLPDGGTLSGLGQKKEYRKYLEKILLDRTDAFVVETTVESDEVVQTGDVRANFQVRDKLYAQQTYLDYLNIGNVWASSRGLNKKGEKVAVAIIDTGIDTDHPEFIDANGKSIISAKSYNATTDQIVEMYQHDYGLIADGTGHGTAVAGVIAAQMDGEGVAGIAPDVELLVVKCVTDGDTNQIKSVADVIFGIYYAIEKDVDVINLSLSADAEDPAMKAAIELAVDSDIIVVAAAGNDGTDKARFPAAWETVIAVGALENGSWEKADYSNYGVNVDIMAPGTTLTTDNNGDYTVKQGTSLSTPQVSAAVAIYKALNPYATFAQVKEEIQAAAVDLGEPGIDRKYGYGAVDLDAFILGEKGTITYDYCTEEIETTKQRFVRGHTIQTVPEPEREFIILDDWYYDKAYTRVFDYDAYFTTEFVEDITLYAKWVNEDDEDASVYSYRTLADGTVEIVKYKGKRRYIQIPETLDGKTVSSIGSGAFYRNTRLREVIFPSQITTIKGNAFEECVNLRKITFTGEKLKEIGAEAFLLCSSLRAVDMPDSVETIGSAAFSDCIKLSSVYIPESSRLISIGSFAFKNCAISTFYLPENISMGGFAASVLFNCEDMEDIMVHSDNTAFCVAGDALLTADNATLVYYPTALRGSYTIPASVTTVSEYAFAGSQLSSVVMPDSITELGMAAFREAEITSVRLSQKLTTIEKKVFEKCNLLTIHIPESIESILEEAFIDCGVLKTVTFAEDSALCQIDRWAFAGCVLLDKLTLPVSLQAIGDFAFADCGKLSGIVIPVNVNRMGEQAFNGCASLKTVEFAENCRLTYVPRGCFQYCSSLHTVKFSKGITELANSAFSDCNKLCVLEFGEGSVLKTVGDNCFMHNSALTDMQLPAGVTTIGEFAYAFSGLTNVYVQESMTTIGQGAFGACADLTEIAVAEENTEFCAQDNVLFNKDLSIVYCVPASRSGHYTLLDTVKITAPYSFYYDRLLTAVTLPEGLEDIRMNSFYNCEKMISVDIPGSVFNIGRCAFQNCYDLRDVNFAEDGVLERLGIYTFVNCGFTEIRIPASITSMAQYVFQNCNNLTTVTFAENSQLPYLAAYTFHSTKVQHVVFEPGSALTSLQANAFHGAHKLKTVDFGDAQITNVDNYAFYACYDLESITLPDTVTYIGRYAFSYCSKLERIDIPVSVDYIGPYAFSSCSMLKVFFKTEKLPANVQEDWDRGLAGYFLNARDNVSTDLWEYIITYNDTIELSVYKGKETELVLDTLDGYVIEAVGADCFRNNRTLEKVTLGKHMARIGNSAFSGCTKLTELVIPASVKAIENYSFNNCSAVITLENGSKLETIGDYAFCSNPTTEMVLPDTVTSIGYGAFINSGMESFTVSENSALRKIGGSAFVGSKITSIHLPAVLEEVGVNAFRKVTTLESVSIADGDVSLKLSNSAFEGSGIREIEIPNRVYYIGEYTFGECLNLTAINVAEDNASYTSLDGVLMDVYGTTLIQYPCGRSGSIEIPATAKVLTYASFKGARHLKEVTFEEGSQIRTLGWQTFSGCTSLEKITVPDSVISFDFYAFENCVSLKEVVLGENSQLVGVYEGAFYNCLNLESIALPDSVIDIGEYAFYQCISLKAVPLTETSGIKGIYDYAFAGCKQIDHVPSYSHLIEIGAHAFDGCRITEFTLPASMLELDPTAFANCGIKDIHCHPDNTEYYSVDGVLYEKGSESDEIDHVAYWPSDKVMLVGDGKSVLNAEDTETLKRFSDLQIAIADTVQIISDEAFEGHTGLKSVTIPESVIGIGWGAFDNCINLETINLNAKNLDPEWCGYGFHKCGTWTAGITLNIGSEVTTIADGLFDDMRKLKRINIAENSQLTYIGNNAFYACEALENVVIPENVKTLGYSAFEGCVSVKTLFYNAELLENYPKEITTDLHKRFAFCGFGDDCVLTIGPAVKEIPARLFGGFDSHSMPAPNITELTFVKDSKCTTIGKQAFYYGGTLRKVMIPESVTSIGDEAFFWTDNLEEFIFNAVNMEDSSYYWAPWNVYTGKTSVKVTIGNKVTRIPGGMFGGLTLGSVTFEEGSVCQSIGAYAFSECKNIEFMVIPESVTSLGEYALSCGSRTAVVFTSKDLPANTDKESFGYNTRHYLNVTDYGYLENGLAYVISDNKAYIAGYWGEDTEVVIPAEINGCPTVSMYGTFLNCEPVTAVTIPDTITEIGSWSFMNCPNLQNAEIPSGVTVIGDSAFNRSGITSLTLPENLVEIQHAAFGECNGLTTVTIPKDLQILGVGAFAMCESLKDVYYYMEADDGSWSDCAFWRSGDITGSTFHVGENLEWMQDDVARESYFTSVVFEGGSNYQYIDSGTFAKMPYLQSVYMNTPELKEAARAFTSSGNAETGFVLTVGPDTNRIPKEMFAASNIREVVFEENSVCAEIGNSAFESCTMLEKIALPASMQIIGDTAFARCTKLGNVTIPASVHTIGNGAFNGCTSAKLNFDGDSLPDNLGTNWDVGAVVMFNAKEDGATEDGFLYYITQSDEAVIYRYIGTEPVITVPNTVADCPVTALNKAAFMGNTVITSVTLPEGISEIGMSMFNGCKNLTEITLPASVTQIGSLAFNGCTGLTSIKLPNGVTEIGNSAFAGCAGLTFVDMPENLTRIGDGAFGSCKKLTAIELPESLTEIGSSVFDRCTGLTAISIPDNVTTIGDSAFYYCSGLSTLKLPAKLTSIGYEAFYSCDKLTSVELPDGLVSIGEEAFSSCAGLTHVTIPDSVTTFDQYGSPFSRCVGLTTAGAIGSGCNIEFGWTEAIPAYAFRGCETLISVVLPEGLREIGQYVFYNCANLESLIIPASVTTIGYQYLGNNIGLTSAGPIGSGCGLEYGWTESLPERAFAVEKLTSVTLPEEITEIPASAFSSSGITSIVIPEGVTTIGYGAFDGCKKLENIVFPKNLQAIGEYAFGNCNALTSITIPDSVTTISGRAFYSCKALTSVKLPKNLTTISDKLFAYCDALTSVEIPEGVMAIQRGVFVYCSALESVVLPESVTTFEQGTFENWTGLKEITIPKSVRAVPDYLFLSCPNLSKVIFTGDAPSFRSHSFAGNTVTVNYPLGNETWTADVMNQKFGTVTWEAVCMYHDPINVVVTAPTCTEQGYTTYDCTICGNTIVDTYVDALGHNYGDWIITGTATCTEPGQQHRDCAVCGTTETQDIEATGHSNESVVTAPTCTEQGYTTHTCTVCGNVAVDTYVEATGHSNESVVTAPTCTEQGYTTHTCTVCGNVAVDTYVEATGHSNESVVTAPTCTEQGYTTHTCTVCGNVAVDTYMEATGHSNESVVTAPTCTEQGYTTHTCTVCGNVEVDTYVDAAGHYYAYWAVVRVPTCTVDGEDRRDCMYCEHYETRIVPAAGHTEGESVTENAVEATCTTDGGYDTVIYCTVCNEELSRAVTVIPATGHTEGEPVVEKNIAPTCTEDGSYDTVVYCTICDAELNRVTTVVPATGHDYESVVTAPTCTEQGSTTHTCTVCGDSYIDSYVNAVGHSYGNWFVVTPATCTEAGEERRDCENCEHFETNVISAKGHTEGEAVVENTVDPDCVKDGSYDTVIYCTICDAELSRETTAVPATGHAAGETVVENNVAPTCTEDGSYDTVIYCTICDAELNRVTTVVPATGHDYESVITAPSCTEKGYTTHTCTVCGDNYVDSYVDATGHSCGKWFVVEAATCTMDGQERRECAACDHFETRAIPATGHTDGKAVTENSVEPTCIKDGSYDTVIYCTVCDEELSRVTMVVPAIGHDYESVITAPTCTERGYTTHTCTVCGDSYVDGYADANGHSYGKWIVVTPATCTEDGEERRGCANCDYFEVQSIPATGHTEEVAVTENHVAPTCTKEGSYDTVIYCTVCDAELSRVTTVASAIGHDYESVVTAPTCTEKGYTTHTCTVCGDSYIDSYVDAVGHSYGEWFVVTPATCTEDGEERRDCVNCEHFEANVIPASGHTEGEAVVENNEDPTCTKDGSYNTVVYCIVCDAELSRETTVVPAKGHDYESVITAPSCTEKGYTTHTCVVCGDNYVDSYVDATGHSYGKWFVVEAATCTMDGQERRECAACDHFETRAIPATGHTDGKAVTENSVEPTCTTDGSYDTVIYCTVCDEELSRVTTVVPAIGHDYESVVTAPTCTDQGYTTYTCTVCVDSYIDSYVEATGHKFGGWVIVTPATCTKAGEERRDCVNCKYFETNVIPAKGHAEGEAVVENTVDSSCTKDGSYDTVIYCIICDAELSRVTTVVPAKGHDYESVVTAPTCTEKGYTTHICTVCGDSYVDNYVDVTGHSYGKWIVVTPASCTEAGEERRDCENCKHFEVQSIPATGHTEGEAVVENNVDPTCTKDGNYDTVIYCTVCDTELSRVTTAVPAMGHDYESVITAPTCTEKGYTTHTCTVCGDSHVDSYVDATGHSYDKWFVATAATCTEDGQQRRDCTNCEHYETSVIPATGHDYESVVTVPTCVERGYTTHTCTVCGDSYVDSYVDATGHIEGESVTENNIAPTCTKDGSYETVIYCTVCDAELNRVTTVVPAMGHDYESVATAPTCTEKGYTTHTCTVCGDSYIDGYVDAVGHSYGEWFEVTSATCTEDGQERRNCVNCEHYEIQVIPAIGHDYESVVAAPTCMEQGHTTHTCTICGDSYVDSYTDALGHKVEKGICVDCGMVFVQIISQPVDVTVAEGEAAAVTVEAEGEGLTYQWYYKNAGDSKFSLTKSFTGPAYSVTMSAARSGRQVYCVITNVDGYAVTTDTVTIAMATTPLEIVAQPVDVTVAEGETAEVTVEVTGKDLTYEWYFMNAGGSKFSKTTAFTGPAYSVTMSAARDGRQVYCVITDAYGNQVTTDTVTLSMQTAPLTIVVQPESVMVAEGEVAEVTVEATGDGLTYTWYYKNSGASKFSKTTAFTGPTYSVAMSAARDGRQVYCVITDAYGTSVTTEIATLSMEAALALEIITQPVDVTVAEGETAEVTVEAVGEELTYAWYYMNAGGTKFSKTTAFTGPIYSVTMSAARDGRQVYCVITDKYGTSVTSDTVTLSMEKATETPLEIVTQPEGFTVEEGETGEIYLEATGDGLTYEWYYKNATSTKFTKTSTFTGPTYSLAMNASRSGRHVYCVITDKYGNSVQTDIVTLNMASDLELLSQPEDVAVAENKTAVVLADVVGEDLTYAWYYRNEGAEAFTKTTAFTGDTYSLKMTAARDGRQVYCVITDGNGNTVATDVVTLTVSG